jgi:CRP-like cAMP-binding protein
VHSRTLPRDPCSCAPCSPASCSEKTAVRYRGPRSASIKAKTDLTTLKLPGPVFIELLRSTPEVALRVAVALAQRLASDRYTLMSDPTDSGAA